MKNLYITWACFRDGFDKKNRVSGHVRDVSFGVSFHDRKETASPNVGILASQLTNFRLFTRRNIQN